MLRKRPASAMVEPNNNDSETQPMAKKRRTMNKRLMAQLESDFTEKMIAPIKSPNGQPTSRFGRKIKKIEPQNSPRQRKSAAAIHTDQQLNLKTSSSKRKVRKVFSIHKIGVTHSHLRLVSNRQSSVLTKSPIQKLISVSKIGLNNNNQFQTQLSDNSVNTEPDISDISTDVSVSEPNFVASMTDCMTESNNDSITDFSTIDYEVNIESFIIPTEITDEIDLTSSPEGSEGSENGDDTKSLTHRSNASQDKTDSPKKLATSDEMISASIVSSKSNFFNDDKSFSEGKSDDCVITGYIHNEHSSDVCSTDDWHVGQIVWAALFGYQFWPAIIFNEEESQIFRKGKLYQETVVYCFHFKQLIELMRDFVPAFLLFQTFQFPWCQHSRL